VYYALMPLQLRSLVREDGQLELSLVEIPMPMPRDHEVVVRVHASPLNPSDLGLLLAAADPASGKTSGTSERPIFTATVPAKALGTMKARVGASMSVGNEGAGVVVAAGSSADAQALLGKTVGAFGGAMYAEYRSVPAAQCVALPEGTTAADGASNFVNPVTALGMVETMHREGHQALVHTAAASNLGQMLVRLCQKDGYAKQATGEKYLLVPQH
jgi:NADPH2:quinone reductase